LYNQLKVPIGLINTSWGGTQSEAWISKQAFEQSPEMKYTANAMGSNNTDQFIKQRGETTLNNIKNYKEVLKITPTRTIGRMPALMISNGPQCNCPAYGKHKVCLTWMAPFGLEKQLSSVMPILGRPLPSPLQ